MCGLPKFHGVAILLEPCYVVGLPKPKGVVGATGVIGVEGAMGVMGAIDVIGPTIDKQIQFHV